MSKLDVRLAKKKEVIKILSDPFTYWKCYGTAWFPRARVHVGLYNYIASYKGVDIALLQVDRFTEKAAIIHGCVIPKYCKTPVLKACGDKLKEMFINTGTFTKIMATVPEQARHVKRYLKSIGFIEEARIKNSIEYKLELQDTIILTYEIKRDT